MIKCIIVEDEPLAAELLADYIKQIPFLNLRGNYGNAIEAQAALTNESIDLLFLDIHLPGIKGLDFIKSIPHPPEFILTTAYHEYALQGYEVNAIDYLLKPFDFRRFEQAVLKARERMPASKNEILTIRSEKKTVVIPMSEILFIESQKEYIKIQTTTNSYRTKYGLSKIEEEFNPQQFLRIHRSFIVSLSKIKAFSTHEIEVGSAKIPVGKNYREQVAERLKQVF